MVSDSRLCIFFIYIYISILMTIFLEFSSCLLDAHSQHAIFPLSLLNTTFYFSHIYYCNLLPFYLATCEQ